jgi:hypothetical protein
MKTTIEIADELFRRSKATAALRGESLKEFVAAALGFYLARQDPETRTPSGWRSVFGSLSVKELAPVDAIIDEEFESIDPGEWS